MYSWYDYQWIDSSVHSVSHKELSWLMTIIMITEMLALISFGPLSRTALLVSALYHTPPPQDSAH